MITLGYDDMILVSKEGVEYIVEYTRKEIPHACLEKLSFFFVIMKKV